MNDLEKLADIVRYARTARRWTQSEMSRELRVSEDAVRRIEGGRYPLPTRQRKDGHQLDKVLSGLGLDTCDVICRCFDAGRIRSSVYLHCLDRISSSSSAGTGEPKSSTPDTKDLPPLQQYIDRLPTTKEALIRQAGMLNAQAMAFLIALERMFNKFEFLVTNQPPFVLFADHKYVTEGSSSTELLPADRAVYHQMIFAHQSEMREMVKQGRKNYRIVLHNEPLIEFLAHRSTDRAERIVEDVQQLLRYRGLDMVIVDQYSESDEFEVLAGHYPYSRTIDGDAISVRHRRVGIGNTVLYQLSLIGMDDQLVAEDHARADAMWKAGLAELDRLPEEYGEYRIGVYAERRKRIVARLLSEALAAAHPELE